MVLPISEKQTEYASTLAADLQKQGYRIHADLRNEKIGFKIRSHTLEKVPFMLVVGDREMEQHHVAVRTQQGEDLGAMGVNEFIEKFFK